jgi:hypothetical protein
MVAWPHGRPSRAVGCTVLGVAQTSSACHEPGNPLRSHREPHGYARERAPAAAGWLEVVYQFVVVGAVLIDPEVEYAGDAGQIAVA